VGHGQSAIVDRRNLVIAKIEECVVQHAQEPWAMLARGTQSPVLGEIEVGVIVQLHLKCKHQNITNPISIAQKANTEICIKANTEIVQLHLKHKHQNVTNPISIDQKANIKANNSK
jgi:hypothetical protein